MLALSKDELQRWVVELQQAEKFRDEQFGAYRRNRDQTQGVGHNLDLYDYGAVGVGEDGRAPVNLAFVLSKNIVPLLFPQNPTVLGLPQRKDDAASAPIAAKLLNHYNHLLKLKQVDQDAVFDAWTLGYGVTKTGYYTTSGPDIGRTEAEEKQRLRDKVKQQVNQTLVALGLKTPPKPPEPPQVITDSAFAVEGSPYVRWVDPFGFLIDPRARSIYDAHWVAEQNERTLYDVKHTTGYSQKRYELEAAPLEDTDIPANQLDRFQKVRLHEIHYKNADAPNGVTVLILGEGKGSWVPLYHEHAIYERMKGWQYDLLAFNKHQHRLYPVSDLSHVRPLLARFNNLLSVILEQVDKFVPKLLVNTAIVQPEGQTALKSAEIGALVKVEGMTQEGNLQNAVQTLSLDSVKQDLVLLLEKVLDFVLLVTGMTRAQLTGLTTASTATEAQIGQGGERNRRVDQSDAVLEFVTDQVEKLWAVITQFVELEEVQLLAGEAMYADETGLPHYSFLDPLSATQADLLRQGDFRFKIEVTSMQRPNLEILRKQVADLTVALLNQGIHQQLALQGKMVDVAEWLRIVGRLYPEIIADVNRIVRPVTPPVQMALGGAPQPQGGDRGGQAEAIRQAPPPNFADLASAAAGEKGQGVPGA